MKRALLGFACLMGVSAPAFANDEIVVNADALQQIQDQQLIKFTGDVEVIMTSMTLFSDEGHAFYGEGGPSDLLEYFAFGDRVRLISPDQEVEADEAVYTFAASTLTFNGNVIVLSGDNRIESDTMVVHIDEGRTSFGSPTAGQRISFTTNPNAPRDGQ